MPFGSKSAFTRFMRAWAFPPHSISTKGAMLRPVPCSPLSDPSKRRTTTSQTSSMSDS